MGPQELAPRHGFEPQSWQVFDVSQLVDSKKSLKSSKASKAAYWYKFRTKLLSPRAARFHRRGLLRHFSNIPYQCMCPTLWSRSHQSRPVLVLTVGRYVSISWEMLQHDARTRAPNGSDRQTRIERLSHSVVSCRLTLGAVPTRFSGLIPIGEAKLLSRP